MSRVNNATPHSSPRGFGGEAQGLQKLADIFHPADAHITEGGGAKSSELTQRSGQSAFMSGSRPDGDNDVPYHRTAGLFSDSSEFGFATQRIGSAGR